MISETKQLPVGIDLGTTESVLAYVDVNDQVCTWKPKGGSALHASAVLVAEDVIVGDEAVDYTGEDGTLIECFKRDMGKSHCVQTVNDVRVPPEILSGFVLQHLRNRAEKEIGSVTDVVISVPAYFDAKRRLATQEAGRLAGMNVVAIINEPTAAAIGYSYHQGLFNSKAPAEEQILLVYDFGGGTFDVTLLRFKQDRFITLATDGDVRLGGFDLDESLADFLADRFLQEQSFDPRSTPAGIKDLLLVANEAKHRLTEQEECIAKVVFNGMQSNVTVTRKQFNDLIAPFIERTLTTCDDVLYEAGSIKWSQVDDVLLVGGSSQIPFISEKLSSLIGKPACKIGNPQELVAEGCALYAANLSENHRLKFDIANVNSHSLGIRGLDVETGRPINKILVPRNTTLPKTVRKKFVTYKENQRSVRLILLEGESENPDLCYEVGKFRVELGINVLKGEIIEVFCNYNKDGTIHVTAQSTQNQRSATLEIQRNIKSLDSLEVWRNRLIIGCDAISASDSFFGGSFGMEDEAHANFKELAKLDAELFEIGKKARSIALPAKLVQQQRLANDLETQVNRLDRMIDRVRTSLKGTNDMDKRQELFGIVNQLKRLASQKRKAYQHSVVSLGRECYSNQLQPAVIRIPFERVEKLMLRAEKVWR